MGRFFRAPIAAHCVSRAPWFWVSRGRFFVTKLLPKNSYALLGIVLGLSYNPNPEGKPKMTVSIFLIKEARQEVADARKDFNEAQEEMNRALDYGTLQEQGQAADVMVFAADKLRSAIENYIEAKEGY